MMTWWQDIPVAWQDFMVLAAYLLPIGLLWIALFYRLRPTTLIKTLLKRYKKTNVLIVLILGICLSVSIAIQATATAYKTAMAKVANRFELVVTAPGSKIDMMLSTVYLQPVAAPLLMGDIYETIANDDKVAVTAPIAYGDSYRGFPVVGSTNSFLRYLSEDSIKGQYFSEQNQAIIGAGVDLNIGDTFIPQHGIHKSFAAEYTDPNERLSKPAKTNKPSTTFAAPKVAQPSKPTSPKQPNTTIIHAKDGEAYFCPADGDSDGDSDNDSATEASLFKKATEKQNNAPELSSLLADKKSPAKATDADAIDAEKTDDKTAGHRQTTLTVVGKMPVTHSPWDKAIITPVESVWAIHGLPTGHPPNDNSLGEPFDSDYFAGTPAILVHPTKRFQAYPLSMQYTTAESMAFMPPTVLAKLNAQLDDVTDVISRVAFTTMCLVLSLAIVTIVLLGKLFEKHFQLLKSLGSPRRFITAIMWGYVTTLALAATALGCFLGYALTLALCAYVEGRLSVLLHVSFGWTEWTLCALFFALTSLLGLIPALGGRSGR